MSEEEKEAIKVLNNFNPTDCGIEDTQAIETLLNLIDNQQKEISLLKDQLDYVKSEYEETIEQQQKEIEELKKNYIRLQNTEAIQDIYIKKGKIKAKIEEIKKEQEKDIFNHMMTVDNMYNIKCQVLQELLEE